MDIIFRFLNNALVREWIMPIFTSVAATGISNVLFERKKAPSSTEEETGTSGSRRTSLSSLSKIISFKDLTAKEYVRTAVVALLVFFAARLLFTSPQPPDPSDHNISTAAYTPSEEPETQPTTESESESEAERWKDDNGNEFIGNQVNGKIEGWGQAFYTNGETYEGEFKAGLCEGYGTRWFPSGGRYEGNFKAGTMDGDGTFYWDNNDRYEGKWEKGVRSGKGLFIGSDGSSEAQVWLDDVFVTNMIWEADIWADENGVFYTGKKKDKKIDGYGHVTYKDKSVYLGEFKDGVAHGTGTIYFESGAWYYGGWEDGKRMGNGIYYFNSNNSWYQGEFLGADRHGHGTYYDSSGYRYEGEWKDNKYFGEGTLWYAPNDEKGRWYFQGEWLEDSQDGVMYYKDGTCKIGIFQDGELVEATGEMNGILNQPGATTWKDDDGNTYTGKQENGVLIGEGIRINSSNELYIGEFKDGTPNGNGTYYYSDGDYYVGEFVSGKRNGNGVYFYSDDGEAKSWYRGEWLDGVRNGNCEGYFHDNGTLNVGEYKDGLPHGKGTCYFTNSVYYGDWQKGARTGRGVLSSSDGNCYVGEYQDNKKSGDGIMYYLNGSRYEGEWENNLYNGTGTFYDTDGTVQYGNWVDGVFQE